MGAPPGALSLSGRSRRFPDVRSTLPLDERAIALVIASGADEQASRRGYVPAGTETNVEREQVLKWGNRHCGEDKARVAGLVKADHDAVIEPFVEGRSERVLIVGDRAWHLGYESADWRKNVKATVSQLPVDGDLEARARRTAERLELSVAGVDYIVNDTGATLLEVNAYPGFDDVPEAAEAFVELASAWWRRSAG